METPEIQHYCTIRENELSSTPGGLFCSRCQKTLVNLEDPEAVASARKSGSLSCGFVRRLAVPALASSLGLSSCAGHKSTSTMTMGVPSPIQTVATSGTSTDIQSQGGSILPGDISPPEEPAPIPVAKRVEGEPGMVISPYTGKKVDVGNVPPGRKAIDPTTKEEKKIFRVPPLSSTSSETKAESHD